MIPNRSKLYNVLGKRVATLIDENQKAHRYKIVLNATDFNLASGIYFYRIKAGSFIKSRKFVLIK